MMDIFTQWTNRLPWLALAVAALFLGLFLATSLATGSSKDIEHDSLGQYGGFFTLVSETLKPFL